jgi:hypothetical protein
MTPPFVVINDSFFGIENTRVNVAEYHHALRIGNGQGHELIVVAVRINGKPAASAMTLEDARRLRRALDHFLGRPAITFGNN